MKRFLFIPFLLICGFVHAAPSSNLSVTPAAVDGATIEASDENSRNNAIVSWANAHDHTDISQTANTLKVGDGTAGNKVIQANNADTNKPYIRFNDTTDRWTISQEGTDERTIVVLTGNDTGHYIIPESPNDDDILIYDATGEGQLEFSKTLDINGGTIDGVTIGGAASVSIGTVSTVTNLGTVSTVDINGGTLDGVQVGGTTATGEIIVNNSSDAADGLGSQGTSGQMLISAGTGSNPTWSNVALTYLDSNTVSNATATGDMTISSGKHYLLVYSGNSDADNVLGLAFNNYTTDGYQNSDGGGATTQCSLSENTDVDTEGYFYGTVYISTIEYSSVKAAAVISAFFRDTGAAIDQVDNSCISTNASATSVEIIADGNIDCKTTLYELY